MDAFAFGNTPARKGDAMELLDLRCFLKLVEEGSVTKAASVMCMSQPNLSRHLLRLEDELGAQLYVRDAKHAKLTDAGRKLLEYATAAIALIDEAAATVGHGEDSPKGHVRIGFGDSEAMAYIMDAIIATRRTCPGVVFHLFAGNSLTLLDRLNAGQVDFVFEVEHVPRVECEELALPGTDVWGVYPLPDSELAKKERVRPEDLAGEPLIVSRQFLKSGFLKRWAGEHYGDIKPVVSTDIFPSEWRRLVEGRVGHMLGYLYFQNEVGPIPGVKGIPFDPPLKTGNALIWKKGRPLTRAAQAFLEELKALL